LVADFPPLSTVEDARLLPADPFILTHLFGRELDPTVETSAGRRGAVAEFYVPSGAGDDLNSFSVAGEQSAVAEAVISDYEELSVTGTGPVERGAQAANHIHSPCGQILRASGDPERGPFLGGSFTAGFLQGRSWFKAHRECAG